MLEHLPALLSTLVQLSLIALVWRRGPQIVDALAQHYLKRLELLGPVYRARAEVMAADIRRKAGLIEEVERKRA